MTDYLCKKCFAHLDGNKVCHCCRYPDDYPQIQKLVARITKLTDWQERAVTGLEAAIKLYTMYGLTVWADDHRSLIAEAEKGGE